MCEREWYPAVGSFGDNEADDYEDDRTGRFVIKRESTDLPTQCMAEANEELGEWVIQCNRKGLAIKSIFATNELTILVNYPDRLNVVQTEMIEKQLEKLTKRYPIEFYNQREMTILEWAQYGINQLRDSDDNYHAKLFENLIEDYKMKCKQIEKLTQDLNELKAKELNASLNSDPKSEIDNSDDENMENI